MKVKVELHPLKRRRVHTGANLLEPQTILSFSDDETSEPELNVVDEEYQPPKGTKQYLKLDEAVQSQLTARWSLPQMQKILKTLQESFHQHLEL